MLGLVDKKEYKELKDLIVKMGGRFDSIDARFDAVDDRFDAVDVRFAEMDSRFDATNARFGSIGVRFDGTDGRLSKLEGGFSRLVGHVADMRTDIDYLKENMVYKKDFQSILDMIDFYSKKADTYFQEHLLLSGQVDRHDKWIHRLADDAGTKLDY